MAGLLSEELDLMGDTRYRSYILAVDKALKSFEYTSEWADLISALGKLNKVLLAHTKYPVVPRRVIMGKRLAQCLHPALPAGVHLKALETYDIIFKAMGPGRLSQELFIYSAGIFPLLGHAAMNVRPALLSLYETHFIPLGTSLRSCLCGLLSGVLLGLEEGNDYFDRTTGLLEKVNEGVGAAYFYGSMWQCLQANPAVRLPALVFILSHFQKKLTLDDQIHIVGTCLETMVHGLCAALQDLNLLVQRSALELLLCAFPLHSCPLTNDDKARVLAAALHAILRRDMSLNRRLFSWLLGSEVNVIGLTIEPPIVRRCESRGSTCSELENVPYFDLYAREVLCQALRNLFRESFQSTPCDLKPYRLLVSLLEKPEIGPLILDDILLDVFRALHFSCEKDKSIAPAPDSPSKPYHSELIKTANLLFGTLEPYYVWTYCGQLLSKSQPRPNETVLAVGSGIPSVTEIALLIERLLDIIPLDSASETTTEHLPLLLSQFVEHLSLNHLSLTELSASLKVCRVLLTKVQPELLHASSLSEPEGPAEDSDSNYASACTTPNENLLSAPFLPHRQFEVMRDITEHTKNLLTEFVAHEVVEGSSLEEILAIIAKSLCFQGYDLNPSAKLQYILQSCVDAECSKNRPELPTRHLRSDGQRQNVVLFSVKRQAEECAPVFKLLCDFLQELSCFPSYSLTGQYLVPFNNNVQELIWSELPVWLQILLGCACLLPIQLSSLQFIAASMIVDLMAANQSIVLSKTGQIALRENSDLQQTVSVVIVPLIDSQHVKIITQRTWALQILGVRFWSYLNELKSQQQLSCVELLHNLASCPFGHVIPEIILADLARMDSVEQLLSSLRKLVLFWHLSRQMESSHSSHQFDRCLLRLFDFLDHSSSAIQCAARDWLSQALLRGDMVRLVDPLLLCLLDGSTAKINVRHLHLVTAKPNMAPKDIETNESRIRAVSSVDGQVTYHLVNQPLGGGVTVNPPRRVLTMTSIANNAGSHALEHALVKGASLPNLSPMSLIINPFPELDPASATITITPSEAKNGDSEAVTVVKGILDQLVQDVVQTCKIRLAKKLSPDIFPLHSHLLLYIHVGDSARLLYVLNIFRTIFSIQPRLAIYTLSSTAIQASKTNAIYSLLARHRQSILGQGFEDDLNAEHLAFFRNAMYLEALLTVLLYNLRTYYAPSNLKAKREDVQGNREVQALSAEILTLVVKELVNIVKESGKGFASYVADMLARCRLQKVALHCLATLIHALKTAGSSHTGRKTFSEQILEHNDSWSSSRYSETLLLSILKLLGAVIMLEDQVSKHSDEMLTATAVKNSKDSQSFKFYTGLPVAAQPMFLAAVLIGLRQKSLRQWHGHLVTIITTSLPFFNKALPTIVMALMPQLCLNLEEIIGAYRARDEVLGVIPPDHAAILLEALTALCHYCLVDGSLAMAHLAMLPSTYSLHGNLGLNNGQSGNNTGQIFHNLVHAFTPTTPAKDGGSAEEDPYVIVRRSLLSHLPRVIACSATLWEVITAKESTSCVGGAPRILRHHILELLSPIAHHHSPSFLAAVAVVWQDRKGRNHNKKILPQFGPDLLVLVDLVSSIKALPVDNLVQNAKLVVKQPPPIEGCGQRQPLDVSLLQFFYAYLQNLSKPQLSECWNSLLALLKEGTPTSPPTLFLLMSVLYETVQKAGNLERKEQKELQEVAAKLIEACGAVAGSCLEQTTWLRRNLAVRKDIECLSPDSDELPDVSLDDSTYSSLSSSSALPSTNLQSLAPYSVQALTVLAELLPPLQDLVYSSEDRDKVFPLLSTVLTHVTPYLKYHSQGTLPSFLAASELLAGLSSFQYSRKAWKKEAFDLLLDPALFQMDINSLKAWKTIVDHLMTHDKLTFRDLLARVSVAPSSSLNLFASKEQEMDQRAQLLKRLAFVLFCSDVDQYQRFMPDIQEKLAESLRLPQPAPNVQAQVFLCFRVILLRISSDHVTSLWPTIIAEMIQVFSLIEHQLRRDSEEFSWDKRLDSAHLRRLSSLDSSWVVSSTNGLQAHGNPAWLQLYLSVCKLLDVALALPVARLPQFQMYRWAFIGGKTQEISSQSHEYVPHITRLAKLMEPKVGKLGGCSKKLEMKPGLPLLLEHPHIKSLMDLYPFFDILSQPWEPTSVSDVENTSLVEAAIEKEFLEAVPC